MKKNSKTKNIIIIGAFVLCCVIVLGIFILPASVSYVLDYETGRTEIQNENISRQDIELLNTCLEYSEKYFQSKLPVEKSKIDKIKDDIYNVVSTTLFFDGFEKSDYENELLQNEGYYKNDGVYGVNYLKMDYFFKLNLILQRTYLLLGEYDKYQENYIENINLQHSLVLDDRYINLLKIDEQIFENNDAVKAVMAAFDKSIELCENDVDKLQCMITASELTLVADKEKYNLKEKYGNKVGELMKTQLVTNHISDSFGSFFGGFSSKELNPDEEKLYKYNYFFPFIKRDANIF